MPDMTAAEALCDVLMDEPWEYSDKPWIERSEIFVDHLRALGFAIVPIEADGLALPPGWELIVGLPGGAILTDTNGKRVDPAMAAWVENATRRSLSRAAAMVAPDAEKWKR